MQPASSSSKVQVKLGENAPFEDIVARIESIAQALEGGEARLEEALSLFEEGMQLCRRGTGRLDEAERKVETLLEDNRVAPLLPDAHLPERG